MKECEQCGGTGRVAEGGEMRYKRLEAGLTLQAVADAMGVSKAYVHQLETGYGTHTIKWTAEITARYERALATAVATRVALGGKQQRGEQD